MTPGPDDNYRSNTDLDPANLLPFRKDIGEVSTEELVDVMGEPLLPDHGIVERSN